MRMSKSLHRGVLLPWVLCRGSSWVLVLVFHFLSFSWVLRHLASFLFVFFAEFRCFSTTAFHRVVRIKISWVHPQQWTASHIFHQFTDLIQLLFRTYRHVAPLVRMGEFKFVLSESVKCLTQIVECQNLEISYIRKLVVFILVLGSLHIGICSPVEVKSTTLPHLFAS